MPVSDLTATGSSGSSRIVRAGILSTLFPGSRIRLSRRGTLEWPAASLRFDSRAEDDLSPGRTNTQNTCDTAVSSSTSILVVGDEPVEISETLSDFVQRKKEEPVATPDGEAWIWPANGEVLSQFSPDDGRNGIDIAGADGSPIRAAAKGKVVYAGTGLRGYGLLIIIKHDETFLTAYAHNRAVKINEGDAVESGQIIAEMGQSGTDSVRLHFEIRRDGQPVDPLEYLPGV